MTVGVKVIPFNVGDTTLTADMEGYTPIAVLFFGAVEGADFITRTWGIFDGTSRFSMADYVRDNLTSNVAAQAGLSVRSDCAVHVLHRTGTSIFIDASAVATFSPDTVTLAWTGGQTLSGAPLTAVVFFGDQWTIRATRCRASTSNPPSGLPYYTNTIGFQPDLVMLFNTPKDFGTASPYRDLSPGYMSVGWACFPKPAYNPPSVNPGQVGSVSLGHMRGYAHSVYAGSKTRQGVPLYGYAGIVGALGNYRLSVTQLSNGFGLSHTLSSASATYPMVALCIKWESGSFVTGNLNPTIGDVTRSFSRWGGTYNASSVDTDPSNHADPSFVLFNINGIYPELSPFNTSSEAWAAMDVDVESGYEHGGGPIANGALGSPATVERVNYISTPVMELLASNGTSITTAMDVQSFDGDGITVGFSPGPPSNHFNWPYLAFARDTGYLHVGTALDATEPNDTWLSGGDSETDTGIFGNRIGVYLDNTEHPDTGDFVVHVTDGAVMDATEPNDTWVTSGQQGGMRTVADGEFIYPLWEGRTFYIPTDLPILHPSDPNMEVLAEEQFLRVPAEDRVLYVPAVEEGVWT